MTGSQEQEPRLGRTILNDLREENILGTFRRELHDIHDFFLTQERRDQLKTMGWFKKFFLILWWLLKSLFFRLTPFRRILFILGIFLLLIGRTEVSMGNSRVEQRNLGTIFGGLALTLVIMLEVKDKLLARGELEAGRTVQRAFIPVQSPEVPGWDLWLFTRPANEVGGDLVDFMNLTTLKFGVALGDVAGKGLGAALLMVKIQATLRALAPDVKSLGTLATKMNIILCRDGVPSRFSSLLYLELRSGSAEVKYVNAGHYPPIVIRDGSLVDTDKGEAALGLSNTTTYSEHSINLKTPATLVAYSDGVTEARNATGEFYGEPRLRSLLRELGTLPAQEIGARIVSSVDNFVSDAATTDDLSLIVLKRKA